jgi:hypothetical protein
MDFEQELKKVADIYQKQGYTVTLRPGPDDLPAFAEDFTVEILGRRGSGGVIVSVKRNREELEADADVPRYAEVTGKQPGWRFDFAILEKEGMERDVRGVREPSEGLIASFLSHAEALLEYGYVSSALLIAWSGLEAATRRRLLAEGEDVGWGSTPRELLSLLNSSGIASAEEFDRLELALRERNFVAHGFDAQAIDAGTVRFLIGMAKRLLEESQAAKQPA